MWEEVTDTIFRPNSEKPPSCTGTLPFLDDCDVGPYCDTEDGRDTEVLAPQSLPLTRDAAWTIM